MDLLLRRLPKFHAILRTKQYTQWQWLLAKQINSINRIYDSSIVSSRRSVNRIMWQNNQYDGTDRFSSRSANTTNNYRRWEPINEKLASGKRNQSELPFKIISYNILAQDLLLKHLQLYKQIGHMYLKWRYRLQQITNEILTQSPDILCLQEVQQNHLADIFGGINEKLSLGCLYKQKTGGKSDGCAIFYNKNIFEIVGSQEVEYFQPGYELLDRHCIALIVKLRCKSNPEVTFLVCTTHMLFNPRRQDVRLAETIVLLAELDRCSVVSKAGSDVIQRIPIILTGDFNFEPHTAPFELITTGSLKYEGLSSRTLTRSDTASPTGKRLLSSRLGITDNCQHFECVQSKYTDCKTRLRVGNKDLVSSHQSDLDSRLFSTGTLTHDLKLRSVYDHFGPRALGSTFQNKWITVDHLFYSKGEAQENLKLMSTYQLPSVDECYRLGHMPNACLGSDHLMLAGFFSLSR